MLLYFGLSTNRISQSQTSKEIVEIGSRSEWRIEVDFRETVVVRVTEGLAEVFGTELANDSEYKFTGQKLAIYSHEGAKIEYSGVLASEYTSEETQVSSYLNLHFALSKIREEGYSGPRVLILGAKDSGKTTLTKMLASYASRMEYEPMVVNLNPSDGAFSIPGTLSAAPISDILDIEDGWGQTYTTGASLMHPKQPTVRYYGSDKIHENLKFYKHNVSRLGVTVCSRISEDPLVKKSGVILDSPPLTIKDVDVIEDIVSDFEVNVIVVVGNERLFIDLKKKFQSKLDVIKVPKSGGCVERDDAFTRQSQQRAIREYFYGTPRTALSPYTVSVDFDVVKVYKPFVETTKLVSSVLPIGEDGLEQEEEKPVPLLEPVEPSSSTLQHCVVAILHADKKSDDDIVMRSGVLGFGVITEADDAKSKLRVLIPVPGRLPDRAMLLGSFHYLE
jgi:polyribonucleotide 5'-hydroxyl-kinase